MNEYTYQNGAIHEDNHKELTIHVSGKTDIAALMKAFMAEDVTDVEEVTENAETPPTAKNEKHSSAIPFSALVTNPSRADVVLKKLHELVERPGRPKTIIMPVRAAMDAGAISRPTWEQFCTEFGKDRVRSKSSLTDYLCDTYTYVGGDFDSMKEIFRSLMQ